MFKFSKHGIKNKDSFELAYINFIEWCKRILPSGTFSTYVDGEPVCFYQGTELTYRDYLRNKGY